MEEECKDLVSIVVPVYNVESYLRECLDSLVGQTYQKTEILLIDDGSTDRSGSICDQYAGEDRRVRVFHRENKGVSSARNAGIDLARGEYLIFVDSDDCIHRELVEMYMRLAGKDTIVLCDLTTDKSIWKESYMADLEQSVEPAGYEHFMELFYRDYINAPFNKFYITDLVKKGHVHFPAERNLGEDLFFNLEYLRQAPFSCQIIHFPLYYYRENRSGSLSNSYREDLLETQMEMFGGLREFLEEKKIWDRPNTQIYYELYWDRLYLTAQIYRNHKKEFPEDKELSRVLKNPVWQEVWEACRQRGLCTFKRKMKKAVIDCWRAGLQYGKKM